MGALIIGLIFLLPFIALFVLIMKLAAFSLAILFLFGALVFVAGVVIAARFFLRRNKRKAEGKKLKGWIALPIALMVVGIGIMVPGTAAAYLYSRFTHPYTLSETPAHYYIERNDLKGLEKHLKNGGNPDELAFDRPAIIFAMVEKDNYEAAEILLQNGANPDIQFVASGAGYPLQYVLSDYFKTNAMYNVERPHEMATLLLRYGANPYGPPEESLSRSPLISAIMIHSTETTKLLLHEYKVDPNQPYVLEYAVGMGSGNVHFASNGDFDAAELLLSLDTLNPDGEDLNEYLLACCDSNAYYLDKNPVRARVIAQLVERGADVNARHRFGYTPLQIVCGIECLEDAKWMCLNPDALRVLIDLGADTTVLDKNGRTLLEMVKSDYAWKQEACEEEFMQLQEPLYQEIIAILEDAATSLPSTLKS